MSECLTIFSCKGITEVESLGGVGWFCLSWPRLDGCNHVIIFHNAYDPRKPGDPAHHRFPVLISEICGAHVDPSDGRVAVRVSRAAPVEGPRQVDGGRSTVRYAPVGLRNDLRIGSWRQITQTSLEHAVAERASWDTRHRAPSAR